jgi:DNA uptake protein ComE-like DNA-binding protein
MLSAFVLLAAIVTQSPTGQGPKSPADSGHVTTFSSTNQLDLNKATLAQIRELPVDSAVAERIFEYLDEYGRMSSFYDLLKIKGITAQKLDELKPLVYVSQRDWEEGRLNNIQRIQRRLASEEGPTAAAVEEWQDLLLSPINVNKASVDELLVLDNVSLVDAVSVVKFQQAGGKLGSRRDLANQVPGLSSYGYRSMRDYVAYEDVKGFGFGGNYRASYDLDPNWFVEANVSEFDQALAALADTTTHWDSLYTPAELQSFRDRLVAERDYLASLRNRASVRHRLRVRAGKYVRVGGWAIEKLYEPGTFNGWKGFASVQDLGPLKKLMVGDYRLTLGQGLLLDNNSELMARVHERAAGLFNDLSENPGFGFRGGATEIEAGRFGLVGFYSKAKRDAILNPDSTVNYYLISTPRYATYKDNLTEDDYGGSVRLDLSNFGFVPVGTRLALNGFGVKYDRSFRPDAKYLDVPEDPEVLDDPNYTSLDTGRSRLFYGADFRTVVENTSLEAEYATKPLTRDSVKAYLPFSAAPKAYLVKARTQYDYLYVTALYRHYDVGYDNPYNRGYCEQLRFADTPLEDAYRVIDPAYVSLQEFPMPKAEQGFFIDTRYQIGRQVTFTRAYLDVWRNLAWAANNYRFQAEVEYQPVYPIRLRFKEKLQSKETPKVAVSTRSFTMESSIRLMASLTNWDYFTAELRHGTVLLTPTVKYGDNADMAGDFVAVQWEHNFSDDFNAELGVATWLTRGMSQWIFEDNGIDFLDGQGFKWYLALTDRVSDNLLVYLKFRQKVSDFPHTALGNNEGIHFPGSTEPVRDFVSRDNSFNVALQVDLLW